MEWNPKSLGQWDWEEHLYFFNAKVSENPKLQSADWSAEADQEFSAGMFFPSGVSGCSESEPIHAASSRSSKSASINSSSIEDSKISIFTLEGSQDDDSTGKKELLKEEEPVETSPAQEPSSASVGEHLLTLKLGKRLYFEDACTESDSKRPSSGAGRKCKSNGQNLQHPTCQVVGCGLDLSSAKDYHRKHRVCESHAKSPKVVIAGFERRFCQQCSRFHGLSEFDDKKRSCRRRLSDHNARRRKPHPEALRSNTSASSSSPYGGRQLVSPFAYSRNATNLAWQNIHNSKLPQTKDFLMKPAKALDKMPSLVTMLSDDSSGLLTSKGIATKSLVTGIEDHITSSDPNATQDVNRALSLLSTNSSLGAAYETKSFTITANTTHHPVTTHSLSHHRLPFALPEYYNADQQPANSSMCISSYPDCDNSNRFQDSQLWNTPYESGFTCNQLD